MFTRRIWFRDLESFAKIICALRVIKRLEHRTINFEWKMLSPVFGNLIWYKISSSLTWYKSSLHGFFNLWGSPNFGGFPPYFSEDPPGHRPHPIFDLIRYRSPSWPIIIARKWFLHRSKAKTRSLQSAQKLFLSDKYSLLRRYQNFWDQNLFRWGISPYLTTAPSLLFLTYFQKKNMGQRRDENLSRHIF